MRRLFLNHFFYYVLFCFVLLTEDVVRATDALNMNTTESKNLVDNGTNMTKKIFEKDMEDLLNRVKKLDPEFYNSIDDLSEDKKMVALRSYFAEKVFLSYKDLFIKEMYEKSKQNGRKVVYKKQSYFEDWHLDRGQNDTDACRNELGKNICAYPDGYEEFRLMAEDKGDLLKRLFLRKDVKTENKVVTCSFLLSKDTKGGNENDLYRMSFSYDCQTEFYEDVQKQRNLEAKDTLNGKYKKRSDGRYGCDDCGEWESSLLPVSAIDSNSVDYMYSHKTNVVNKE